MGTQKFRITEMKKDVFFLRVGSIVYINWAEERVYSEDKKQYMPLSVALKLGLNGEQVE